MEDAPADATLVVMAVVDVRAAVSRDDGKEDERDKQPPA
jgi:hypothetical protein